MKIASENSECGYCSVMFYQDLNLSWRTVIIEVLVDS